MAIAPTFRCPSCRFSCTCLADHRDCRMRMQHPRGHHPRVLGEPNPDPLDLDLDQLQQDGAQEAYPSAAPWWPISRGFPGE